MDQFPSRSLVYNVKKRCSKCKKMKDIFNFAECKGYRDGHRGQCKQCLVEYKRNRPATIKIVKTEKVCTCCKRLLTIDNFHKDQRNRDGHIAQCKLCRAKTCHKRYLNKPDEINAKSLEWKRANPERGRFYTTRYKKNNPEKVKENEKRYIQSEKGKRMASLKRRARSRRGGNTTVAVIRVVEKTNIKKFGVLTCDYCKIPIGKAYHLDHKNPIIRGGKSVKINLCVACPECNLHKGTLTADEFRKRLRVV